MNNIRKFLGKKIFIFATKIMQLAKYVNGKEPIDLGFISFGKEYGSKDR